MRWYVERSGKIRGPFEEDALRTLVATGKIDGSTRLRNLDDDADAWRPLEEIPELAELQLVGSLPPPGPSSDWAAPMPASARELFSASRMQGAERVGRALIWTVMTAAIVMVPVELAKQRRAAKDLRESEAQERVQSAARATQEKLQAQQVSIDARTARIAYGSMGNGFTSLNVGNASAHVWFTNVSARSGHVCVTAVVTNSATQASAESMPACAEVLPFASAVHITLMFGGANLSALCKAGPCSLHVTDAVGSEP